MATSETGGATTQAGVHFQNCIAALRLASMVSGDEHLALGRVVSVRVEAPEHVDDVVVTYTGGKEYIQAKLDIAVSSEAWRMLWRHFHSQYQQLTEGENRERITLAARWSRQMNDLENLVERASSSASAAEWESRLTAPQKRLLQSVAVALGADDPWQLFDFCRAVKVWQLRFEADPMGSDTFEDEVRRILRGTVEPLDAVFPVLLGAVADAARRRGAIGRDELLTQLRQRGFRIPPSSAEDLTSVQRRILERELSDLSEAAELLSRKVSMLRKALVIETSVTVRFQLEHQLQEAETELAGFHGRIGVIERKLQ